MLTPKGQQPPRPPDELRPWYYLKWFLIPTFVLGWPTLTPVSILWPLWAVLIIRSPWHNGIIPGGLAWAMLLTGAYGIVQLIGDDPFTAMQVLLPGVALTVVTQVLWSKHKQTLPGASPTAVEDSTQDLSPDTSGEDSPGSALGSASDEGATPRFRRAGVRRRRPRGRSPRSGRRSPPS